MEEEQVIDIAKMGGVPLIGLADKGKLRRFKSVNTVDKEIKIARSAFDSAQQKTFERWINSKLSGTGLVVNDLVTDLKDGRILYYLLEVLTGESLRPYGRLSNGKMRVQHINNVSIVFNFLADYDVKLVGIGPTDVVNGNGLVLGLVWSIMIFFFAVELEIEEEYEEMGVVGMSGQLEQEEEQGRQPADVDGVESTEPSSSVKRRSSFTSIKAARRSTCGKPKGLSDIRQALISWLQEHCVHQELEVKDLTRSLRDGKVLLAVLNHLNPDECPYTLTGNPLDDLTKAVELAESVFDVEKLIDPKAPESTSDERCMIPYLMLLKEKTRSKPILLTAASFSRHKSKNSLTPTYSKLSLNPAASSRSLGSVLSNADLSSEIIIPSAVQVEDEDDDDEEETGDRWKSKWAQQALAASQRKQTCAEEYEQVNQALQEAATRKREAEETLFAAKSQLDLLDRRVKSMDDIDVEERLEEDPDELRSRVKSHGEYLETVLKEARELEEEAEARRMQAEVAEIAEEDEWLSLAQAVNDLGGEATDLDSVREEILSWINFHTEHRRADVPPLTNISSDIRDGKALLALLNHFNPRECEYNPSGIPQDDLAAAVRYAESVFHVTENMLDPTDPLSTSSDAMTIPFLTLLMQAMGNQSEVVRRFPAVVFTTVEEEGTEEIKQVDLDVALNIAQSQDESGKQSNKSSKSVRIVDAEAEAILSADASIEQPLSVNASVSDPLSVNASVTDPLSVNASVTDPLSVNATVSDPLSVNASVNGPASVDASVSDYEAFAPPQVVRGWIEVQCEPTTMLQSLGLFPTEKESKYIYIDAATHRLVAGNSERPSVAPSPTDDAKISSMLQSFASSLFETHSLSKNLRTVTKIEVDDSLPTAVIVDDWRLHARNNEQALVWVESLRQWREYFEMTFGGSTNFQVGRVTLLKGATGSGHEGGDLSDAIVFCMNQVRRNPLEYAAQLEKSLEYYDGKIRRVPNTRKRKTHEGAAGVKQAISRLKSHTASLQAQGVILPLLQRHPLMDISAGQHADDLRASNRTGHTSSDGRKISERLQEHGEWHEIVAEMTAYRETQAAEIVEQLVVCDGEPSRYNFLSLLSPDFKVCGIATRSHPSRGSVTVIPIAGGYGPRALEAEAEATHTGANISANSDFQRVLNSIPIPPIHKKVHSALKDGATVSINYEPFKARIVIKNHGKDSAIHCHWN